MPEFEGSPVERSGDVPASNDPFSGAASTDAGGSAVPSGPGAGPGGPRPANRRRRGSRGGRGRRPAGAGGPRPAPTDGEPNRDLDVDVDVDVDVDDDVDVDLNDDLNDEQGEVGDRDDSDLATADDMAAVMPIAFVPGAGFEDLPELPDRPIEGKVQSTEVADRVLVRKPQIGDSRPAPAGGQPSAVAGATSTETVDTLATPGASTPKAGSGKPGARQQGGKQPSGKQPSGKQPSNRQQGGSSGDRPAASGGPDITDDAEVGDSSTLVGAGAGGDAARKKRRRGGRGKGANAGATPKEAPIELDDATREARRGRERNGRPVGRYLMAVHVSDSFTQIAVLEGRNLIEHFVSRPTDDVNQIHGNLYLGKVTNVLPGMEAAFVDIGTPKNAVLYRGDIQYDTEDIVEGDGGARIEQILRPRQTVLAQVTKNPIGVKGARLTQEVSLPGRFVVLVPNSRTYGISKRLSDEERKRLRAILDKVKPDHHGVIVRTAAEGVTAPELQRDLQRLLRQWEDIEAKAAKAQAPRLVYREPSMAVRVIREEFNRDYRGVVIDDPDLYEDVRSYVESTNPELVERIRFYDNAVEGLPLFEAEHVHEQVHKALDRKVWLPSGGSLIIEHTEALTVIDVNTGKNVGTSSLEETVFRNNLEAAEEIARQLRLRDIGGIIVIDFIDMEIRENRRKVIEVFRDVLARDKTRTQVFDISDLGLVEMTRKRIGEGMLTAFAHTCEMCVGRGLVVEYDRI